MSHPRRGVRAVRPVRAGAARRALVVAGSSMETGMKQGGRIGMVWPGMWHGPTSAASAPTSPDHTIMVGKGVWTELRALLDSEGPGALWANCPKRYDKMSYLGVGTWYTGLPGQAPQGP